MRKGWFWVAVRTRASGDGAGGPEWLAADGSWTLFPGRAYRWRTKTAVARRAAAEWGATLVHLPTAALGG